MSEELECKAETLALGIINKTKEAIESKCRQLHSFLKEKLAFTQSPSKFSTIFFHSLSSPILNLSSTSQNTYPQTHQEPSDHQLA